MANAYRAKRNGDFEQAFAEFGAVLQAPEAEQERAEARFETGVCALLSGDPAAAQGILTQFLRDYPDDHRAGTAHFYVAAALSSADEPALAIDHYRAYLENREVVADLVYTRIARLYSLLGDYEAAAEAYQAALERAPDLGQQYDLREQIGLAYSASGQYPDAVDWLQSVIERSENVYRVARIWYLIGQTHRLAGQEQQALEAFAQAVNADPRPGYAHAALVELVEAEMPVNEYQRGLIDYYAGSYSAAVAAFYRYIESTPDYHSDAHYYAALSYLSAGSYALAVEECDRALAAFPSTIAHWGELWLTQARALARLGEDAAAVDRFVEFADSNPEHALAPQARWEAAQLLEEAGEYLEAASVYASLAEKHGNAEMAPAARFRAGLSRYRAGDVDGALIAWRELSADYPGSSEAVQARYWQGKVLWSLGQREEASTLLRALATEHPRNYYGLRAAHLLESGGHPTDWPQPPSLLHLTSDAEAETRDAEIWLREWTGVPPATDLSQVPSEIADDPRFRRGMELLALGLHAEAGEELDSLRRELGQDPVALYRFACLARDVGLCAPSLRATIDLIALAPENSVLEMPTLIQRLAFPVYFQDLVISESDTYRVDPLLMFALIRQESVFDDQVASWAGAVGLTQVMPSTGEWIAEMMPWPQYREELLRRAYINVRFGAWFLARILEEAEGSVMASLAGYNGGPANSTRWTEQANGDPDLFVEVITRPEPRLYVREIYRHYDVYSQLYGGM